MSVGITAKSLVARSNHPAVKQAVLDERTRIDDQILRAHSIGQDRVRCKLTSDFQIGSLSKQDAQLIVYTELLKLYNLPEKDGGKGFTATIVIGEPSLLDVKWFGGLNENEKKSRKEYLTQYLRPLY